MEKSYNLARIEAKRIAISDIEYSETDKVRYKINADFILMNVDLECYREQMVSYYPMMPLLYDTVPMEEADYILYMHPYARCEDLSQNVIEEIQYIDDRRKAGAEIIVVGKAANAEKLLNGSIKNITFWGDHFTEKLGKKFELDIKEQYFVFDEDKNFLAIWPVDGCLRKCKFCRRCYMDIKFESLSLETIKRNLDFWKENNPEKLSRISLRAENLTEYGIDIYGEQKLHLLIDLLDSYEEIKSIEIPIGICLGEITPEILNSLCKCKKIKEALINIETGSNRLLKLIGKKHSREDAIYIFNKLREANPNIYLSSKIMIGLPTEEFTDIYELADLIKECNLDHVSCNYFIVAPRLPLAKLPQISESLKEYHLRILLESLKGKNFTRDLSIDHYMIGKKKSRKWIRMMEKLKLINQYAEFPCHYVNITTYKKKSFPESL